ncbi:MAG: alpha/beta hydrolase [Candidatus Colwellbacteria bacterium]|nr:alpha/beta hydrolase [Candidatus Colwellbacteria bacterium]
MGEKRILIKGVGISCFEKGKSNGNTILFLHGLGGSKREFATLIFPLIPDCWRCVALDFPGFGASDLSKTEEHGVPLYTEIVKEYLDLFAIEKAYLFGMSMGGSVALRFGGKYPDRVAKIAAQGAPIYGKNLLTIHPALSVYEQSLRVNRAFALYSMAKTFDSLKIGVYLYPKFLLRIFKQVVNICEIEAVTEELLEIVRKDFREARTWAIAEVIASLLELDLTKTLQNFTIPTLILDGETAYKKPGLASTDHILSLIPTHLSRVHSIPEVGHMATILCPKEVANVTINFFET